MGKKGETSKRSKKGSPKNAKGKDSIGIGDGNEFKGSVIGHHNVNIINEPPDNSVTYPVDRDDVTFYKKIAPYLIGRFGKKRIGLTGAASFIIGLFGMFTGMNSATQNIKVFFYLPTVPYAYMMPLIILSIVVLIFGGLLVAVVQYHTDTQCNNCNREYAYEEVGTPTVREVKTFDGPRQITTRTYKCRFCDDVDVRTESELVTPQ